MSPRRTALLLVGIAGLLLMTNSLWLFPHEGQARYTYDRSEITVRDGSLEYRGETIHRFMEANSLVEVACQPSDDEQARACVFDAHLVDHPPVRVPNEGAGFVEPEFVQIDGAYYRRIHRLTEINGIEQVIHDVARVEPETVLAETSINLTGVSPEESRDLLLGASIAVTGTEETTFTDLDETDLGRVFRLDGAYYTVVQTDRTVVDHGFAPLRYEVPRYLLGGLGVFLLIVCLGWYLGRDEDETIQ